MEPLKQLGINMSVANLEAYALSQGIEKSYNSMTQSEQALLRYNYLMKVTADAQGDFAKTSDSFANQQRILSLQIENLSTNLGKKLLPYANDFIKALNGMLDGSLSVGEGIDKIMDVVMRLVDELIKELPKILEIGGDIILTLVEGILKALPDIAPKLTEIIMKLIEKIIELLPLVLQVGMSLLRTILEGIVNSLPSMIPVIVEVLLEMVDVIIDNLDLILSAGIDILMALLVGIIFAIPQILTKIPIVIFKIQKKLTEIIIKIIPNIGKKLMFSLLQGALNFATTIALRFKKMAKGTVLEPIADGLLKIVNVGKNVVLGLWQGWNSKTEWLKNKIREWVGKPIKWAKKFLKINSPSKVWANEVGEAIPSGMAFGIDVNSKQVNDAIKKMNNQVLEEAKKGIYLEMGNVSTSSSLKSNANFNSIIQVNNELKSDVYLDKTKVGQAITPVVSRTLRTAGVK